MDYEHDIFVSYKRAPGTAPWVKNHLVPRLQMRIDEILPFAARIFCDYKMEEGVNWPAELRRRIRGSKLLVSVWSAPYFTSPWCMAEWQSFKAREIALGLFNDEDPRGLVYPVRYADGDYFHPEAKVAQCRHDFSSLRIPDPQFAKAELYLQFDEMIREMAENLSRRLADIPPWRNDFPILEPAPYDPPAQGRIIL